MKEKTALMSIMIGSLLVASVTVYAATLNRKVEAWLANDVNLAIGGSADLTLPEDVHILNYKDHIYLPMRYVAEQMGGTVYYDADRLRVVVATPEPVFEIVEVEKPAEKTASPTTESTVKPQYYKYPVRIKHNEVTINVTGITRSKDRTFIYVDMLNESMRYASLGFNKAYIEIDGVKYNAVFDENAGWGNSIQPSEEWLDRMLIFPSIPSGAKEMTIILPVAVEVYDSSVGMVDKEYPFTFNISFD